MKNEDDGEHPCAGQSCPASLNYPQTEPPDGGDDVRVYQVPPEKLTEIQWLLEGNQKPEAGSHLTKTPHPQPLFQPMGEGGAGLSPEGGEGGEIAETLKPEIKKWMAAGVKLAGVLIIAACVAWELSAEPPPGQCNHAHGGHENKRVAVRRRVVRKKSDGADPKDDNSETGCKNRVDLCENRTDDGVCLIRQQSCLWMAKGIGDGSWDLGQKLLDLESAMKNGFQDLKRNLRRAKVESPVASPPNDHEAARVFALMKSLDAGERVRKAPLHRVFRLLVLDDLSQNAAARKCRCSTSLVSLRAKEIERRMGLPVTVLRSLASRVGELVSVEDSRARKIYRHGLTDDTGEDG